VRDAVADGDYSDEVGNEIIRQVNVLAVAAGHAPAPPSSPAPVPPPPPPPPVAAPPPVASPSAATGLSAADEAAARGEARELWAEVDKGLIPLAEVQDVRHKQFIFIFFQQFLRSLVLILSSSNNVNP